MAASNGNDVRTKVIENTNSLCKDLQRFFCAAKIDKDGRIESGYRIRTYSTKDNIRDICISNKEDLNEVHKVLLQDAIVSRWAMLIPCDCCRKDHSVCSIIVEGKTSLRWICVNCVYTKEHDALIEVFKKHFAKLISLGRESQLVIF